MLFGRDESHLHRAHVVGEGEMRVRFDEARHEGGAMRVDDALTNGQPESSPLRGRGPSRLHSIESIKDARQLACRNSVSAVRDTHLEHVSTQAGDKINWTAGRRELISIVQQIDEDLLDLDAVDVEGRKIRRHVDA